jgi:hypothetical protein
VHNGGAYGDGTTESNVGLDSELREQLESLANSRSLPAGLVRRAKIILLSAYGKNDREIAPQLEMSRNTIGLWRRRFLAQGVSGLYDELRPGRLRPISDDRYALWRAPYDFANIFQRGGQSVPVVRISVQRLCLQNKMSALGRMQIGGQRNFAAELVRCARLAFADAFHFGRVPGKKITRIAAPLLRDAPRLAQRDFQPLCPPFR